MFELEFTANVTKDGQKFVTAHIVYSNLPRDFFLAMEADLIALQAKWNKEAQALAKK